MLETHTHELCGQHVRSVNVQLGGRHSHHWAPNSYSFVTISNTSHCAALRCKWSGFWYGKWWDTVQCTSDTTQYSNIGTAVLTKWFARLIHFLLLLSRFHIFLMLSSLTSYLHVRVAISGHINFVITVWSAISFRNRKFRWRHGAVPLICYININIYIYLSGCTMFPHLPAPI